MSMQCDSTAQNAHFAYARNARMYIGLAQIPEYAPRGTTELSYNAFRLGLFFFSVCGRDLNTVCLCGNSGRSWW